MALDTPFGWIARRTNTATNNQNGPPTPSWNTTIPKIRLLPIMVVQVRQGRLYVIAHIACVMIKDTLLIVWYKNEDPILLHILYVMAVHWGNPLLLMLTLVKGQQWYSSHRFTA